MQLAVKVDPTCAADVLRGTSGHAEIAEFLKAARGVGITLRPMHRDSTDPELRTWFAAEVSRGSDAEAIAAILRKYKPVLAAYPKPPDELP